MRWFYVVCICGTLNLLMSQSVCAASPGIRFYSEIVAPFYFLDEQGKPQGASYDLANAIIETAQIDATIQHMTWARAYYEATHNANVILTSVLKTPARENKFQWLGLVHEARASMIALRSRNDVKVSSLDDAREWRVGTIRGYGSAKYLQEHGFAENANLVLAKDGQQLWTLLYRGRIDMVLSNLITERYEIASIGFQPDEVVEIFNVKPLNLNLEMATGHHTPFTTVQKIRQAMKTLKQNGRFQAILSKWELDSR